MRYSCRFCGTGSSSPFDLGLCSACSFRDKERERERIRKVESAALARVQEEEDHMREMEAAAWARVEAEERERLERKEQESRLMAARNLLAESMVRLSTLENDFPVGGGVDREKFTLRVAALQAKLKLLELKKDDLSGLDEMKEMCSIHFRVSGYIARQVSAGLLNQDPFEVTHKRLEDLRDCFNYCNDKINGLFDVEITSSKSSAESLNKIILGLDGQMQSLSGIQNDIAEKLRDKKFDSLENNAKLLIDCSIGFEDKRFLDYSIYRDFSDFTKGKGSIIDAINKKFEGVRGRAVEMLKLNGHHKSQVEDAIVRARGGYLKLASSLIGDLGDVRFLDVNYTKAQVAIQELSLAVEEFEMCRWYLSHESIFMIGAYARNVNEASLIRHLNKYKSSSPFGFSARNTYEEFKRARRNRLISKIILLISILTLLFAIQGFFGGLVVGDHDGEAYFGKDVFEGEKRRTAHAGELEDDSVNAELGVKLKRVRAQVAEVNAEIAAERARWQNALAVINRLTVNKTRPVREGSPEYYRCLEASKVIQEVEAGAQKLKAKKARLEAELKDLEK